MSATSVLRPAHVARPRPTVRGILGRIARLDALHRNRVALEALDDHLLRDIGLTRADVDEELRRPLGR